MPIAKNDLVQVATLQPIHAIETNDCSQCNDVL